MVSYMLLRVITYFIIFVVQYVFYSVSYYLASLRVSFFFFFKQKPAYEMLISDWISDVCSSDLRERRMGLEGALDDLGDAEEAEPAGQEGSHGFLVGGVEGDRCRAAGAERGAGQRQGGKPHGVGRLEGEPADGGEIETLDRRRHALRPGQRVGDRRAHVGPAELRQHRAVDVGDHGVDHRFRVHQDVEIGRAHV